MPNQSNKKTLNDKPKLRPWVKVTIIVIAAILVLAGIVALAVNLYIDSKIEKIHIVTNEQVPVASEDELLKTEEEHPTWEKIDEPGKLDMNGIPCICDTDDVLNVLLIGIDARDKSSWSRNDTTILVSLNTKTHEVIMASFLRDTLVTLGDKNPNRINVAYALGGPDFLIETLKENFNISVSHYVTFNFFSFVDVVEEIGGLDIELSADELDVINFYLLETNELYGRPVGTDNLPLTPGTYHLNGYQALGYARNRYSAGFGFQYGSDFVRTTRQRKVIQLILDKVKTMSFSEIDSLIDKMLPQITTNMQKPLIKSLVLNLPTYFTYEIIGLNVPQDGYWRFATYQEMSIIEVDKKPCIEDLYKMIYKTELPK